MNEQRLQGIGMTSQRTRMRLIDRLVEEGIENQQVLDAIASTPRHIFIDEALSHRAYEDTALPIGCKQTISQPYIVARMTELLLQVGNMNKVLEIGTGSGYQTAILAQIFPQVYSIERIQALQQKAKRLLRQLKLYNVKYHYGDGFKGWPSNEGFDGIIVTAAPSVVPQTLLQQLADGGALIIPVGSQEDVQTLQLIQRHGDEFETHELEKVRFVPLLSGALE
jgi:protein-L-isoaspartate(D-aspartate) O-methyltransferase